MEPIVVTDKGKQVKIKGIRFLTEKEYNASKHVIPQIKSRYWIGGSKVVTPAGVRSARAGRQKYDFRPVLILENTNDFGNATPFETFEYKGLTWTVINTVAAICEKCLASNICFNELTDRFPVYFEEVA